MKYYQTGDTVWHIPGEYGNGLLVVKCKIVDVESLSKGRILFWLDEPLGQGVSDLDVFSSLDVALRELRSRYSWLKSWANPQILQATKDATLENFRQEMYSIHPPKLSYFNKAEGKEWFSVRYLGENGSIESQTLSEIEKIVDDLSKAVIVEAMNNAIPPTARLHKYKGALEKIADLIRKSKLD